MLKSYCSYERALRQHTIYDTARIALLEIVIAKEVISLVRGTAFGKKPLQVPFLDNIKHYKC